MVLNLTAAFFAILIFSCQVFYIEQKDTLIADNAELQRPSTTAIANLDVIFITKEGMVLNYDLASFTANSFTANSIDITTRVANSSKDLPNTDKTGGQAAEEILAINGLPLEHLFASTSN